MPYGYALAAECGAKNYVVEPFYADKQRASVKAMIEEQGNLLTRIPYKVEGVDMLEYLRKEATNFYVVACGIEDCILPSRLPKESGREIYRVLEKIHSFSARTVIYNPGFTNDRAMF